LAFLHNKLQMQQEAHKIVSSPNLKRVDSVLECVDDGMDTEGGKEPPDSPYDTQRFLADSRLEGKCI